MSDDNPPGHTIEALNLVFPEDEVKSWVLRWRAADPDTRRRMETEVAIKAPPLARRDAQRFAERQQVKEMFERGGLESSDPT